MATFPFAPGWQRGSFELNVLDVGQGDSLLLELGSDVLTTAQHGSKNSTKPNFLAAVQPYLALISSGEQSLTGIRTRNFSNG
jgi:beta-lactamase superfamily II metal-dependent hydrolase